MPKKDQKGACQTGPVSDRGTYTGNGWEWKVTICHHEDDSIEDQYDIILLKLIWLSNSIYWVVSLNGIILISPIGYNPIWSPTNQVSWRDRLRSRVWTLAVLGPRATAVVSAHLKSFRPTCGHTEKNMEQNKQSVQHWIDHLLYIYIYILPHDAPVHHYIQVKVLGAEAQQSPEADTVSLSLSWTHHVSMILPAANPNF